MKACKWMSYIFAAVGVVLMVWSLVGRFVGKPMVLGWIVHKGLAASSVMIGADTFFLLAILMYLYKKE